MLAILAGTAVYLLDRDWSSVLFLAPLARWQPGTLDAFGVAGYSLPSFLHAYAFTLLLILALLPSKAARWLGSLTWLALAAGLELLQADAVKAWVTSHFTELADAPIAGEFFRFILFGRLDAADLAATALGVALAALTSFVLEKQP